ncbi:hypothetical protein [Marinobacter lutaoensis]|uniref:hypothetical protein n=1 Tax=Marinobacter lutaoensis TaxID=135739 RepID=UPI0020CD15F3|nr:hypothetical protein [Marinobacter lutaoensis]
MSPTTPDDRSKPGARAVAFDSGGDACDSDDMQQRPNWQLRDTGNYALGDSPGSERRV